MLCLALVLHSFSHNLFMKVYYHLSIGLLLINCWVSILICCCSNDHALQYIFLKCSNSWCWQSSWTNMFTYTMIIEIIVHYVSIFLFAAIHITRIYRGFFIDIWCCLYQCKFGTYHACFVWDLSAERMVRDVSFYVRILQGCWPTNLAPSASTETIWQRNLFRGFMGTMHFFYTLIGSKHWWLSFVSDFEEAGRSRGWSRSPLWYGGERYWSFDSLFTWREGIPNHFANFIILQVTCILFALQVVKQYLAFFPMVQLSATVSPITRTVLKVFQLSLVDLFLIRELQIYVFQLLPKVTIEFILETDVILLNLLW